MVTIYNSELFKELREGVKLQQLTDTIPSQLADKVVPVMEVNPKLLKVCNIVKSATCNNATTATIYTAPTDRDFFIVSAALSVIKDVTSTSVQSAINVVPEDAVTGSNICVLAGITLTPQTLAISQTFIPPLKLKRGSVIGAINSANVANVRAEATITGFTLDNARA
jgi:hypothetical protein